jgi:hypothetical protein
MPDSRRRPISTRHAFALAFDLAVRRDPLHSLVVPILLRAPWTLTLALLPSLETVRDQAPALLVASVALVGDFVTLLVVGAMLRFRARSVFNTPPTIPPAPPTDCYGRGLGRIPWLIVTEVVRNGLLTIAASCSVLPAAFMRFNPATFFKDFSNNFLLLVVAGCLVIPTLFLGFRLAVATESVVLDQRDMTAAFQRSFRMMQGRFERWFEMITASAALVLGLAMISTLLGASIPALGGVGQIVVFWLFIIAATPVIQYAWTFFYLRLVEIDQPIIEVGPFYAGAGGVDVSTPELAPPATSTEDRPPVPAAVAVEERPHKENGVPLT